MAPLAAILLKVVGTRLIESLVGRGVRELEKRIDSDINKRDLDKVEKQLGKIDRVAEDLGIGIRATKKILREQQREQQ
jgi:hypothetical protein